MTSSQPSRRLLLGAGLGLSTVAATAGTSASATASATASRRSDRLRFAADGTFRIVQFNDTQDNHRTDVRTVELVERTLEAENPGFVVVNGDVVNGDMTTEQEVKQAYHNVVLPMEERGIPWAITFGNHDEDSAEVTGMTEPRIREFLRGYRWYVGATADGVSGDSNQVLRIRSCSSRDTAFAVWLLDSGRYSPETVAGQAVEEYTYETIHSDQVDWYRRTSLELQGRSAEPVPGLMFFHIPLWEFRHMWFGSPTGSTEAEHEAAVAKHGIVGERNEREYTAQFNPGLFHTALERGDVKGMFCGHDHVNDYVGNYFGIQLGYGPGTGFGTYGLEGEEVHRMRGARVFELDENHGGVFKATRTVFASDFGIDLSPAPQPLENPTPVGR
ncbi:metallophosphoesterase family protein [Kineococcus sp. SYSU DK003]|uniref:metallophosphoesterase family protein n=1 Tax=Kineococcus sp. SYSU DK003 TaxID=3383124 RepID=UPI003D7E5096